jgi:hypothetical protein
MGTVFYLVVRHLQVLDLKGRIYKSKTLSFKHLQFPIFAKTLSNRLIFNVSILANCELNWIKILIDLQLLAIKDILKFTYYFLEFKTKSKYLKSNKATFTPDNFLFWRLYCWLSNNWLL